MPHRAPADRRRVQLVFLLLVATLLLGTLLFRQRLKVGYPEIEIRKNSDCPAANISETEAMDIALEDARFHGFEVDALRNIDLYDASQLQEMDFWFSETPSSPCFWLVEFDGSIMSDELSGPPDIPGLGPTSTPYEFSEFVVGVDALTGEARFRRSLSDARAFTARPNIRTLEIVTPVLGTMTWPETPTPGGPTQRTIATPTTYYIPVTKPTFDHRSPASTFTPWPVTLVPYWLFTSTPTPFHKGVTKPTLDPRTPYHTPTPRPITAAPYWIPEPTP